MFSFSARERRSILRVLILSSLLAAVGGFLLRDSAVPPLSAALYGALAGVICPLAVIAVRELVWHSPLPGMAFAPFTVINLALNAIAILLGLQLAAVPFSGLQVGINVRAFAIASVLAVGFTAWYMLDRMLGAGVLVGLLTGRYHKPRYEHRVFLFADLTGSTSLAQALGDLTYHSFLNRLFSALDRPIERHGGTVHRYLGMSSWLPGRCRRAQRTPPAYAVESRFWRR